jgi:hypothetical protein
MKDLKKKSEVKEIISVCLRNELKRVGGNKQDENPQELNSY